LALDALPELPLETEIALRAPVERLCDVTGTELDRIKSGWREKPPFRKTVLLGGASETAGETR